MDVLLYRIFRQVQPTLRYSHSPSPSPQALSKAQLCFNSMFHWLWVSPVIRWLRWAKENGRRSLG
jgi:hypothetical protein